MTNIPAPNLQGNYSGSCVVCLQGTDTALAFTGEAEWLIAGLVQLGLPTDEAYGTAQVMFENEHGCEPGMVPGGVRTYGVQVCGQCAAKAPNQKFPAPGLVALGVPNIAQVRSNDD